MSKSKTTHENGDVASEKMMQNLVNGNTQFAIDIYKVLSSREGNIFYSPYSISLALALTFAGARGETERQMAATLHFDLAQAKLHPAFNALDLALAAQEEAPDAPAGSGFRLHILNALWGQDGHTFKTQFLDNLARYYGAGVRPVDFEFKFEDAREQINSWVTEKTNGRIEELIPFGILNALTRLVLTNTVYFKAAWRKPFVAALTTSEAFHLNSSEQMTVPMMQQVADFGYRAGPGCQLVELLYSGGEFSMLILFPDSGEFATFEDTLTREMLQQILSGMEKKSLDFSMPIFKTSSAFDVSAALQGLGMTQAFGNDADFSGMDDSKELYINAILHRAFVSVDEEGTEAAAATAVAEFEKSIKPAPLKVAVDRPFLFMIRDMKTGTILFMGRIMDPTL